MYKKAITEFSAMPIIYLFRYVAPFFNLLESLINKDFVLYSCKIGCNL